MLSVFYKVCQQAKELRMMTNCLICHEIFLWLIQAKLFFKKQLNIGLSTFYFLIYTERLKIVGSIRYLGLLVNMFCAIVNIYTWGSIYFKKLWNDLFVYLLIYPMLVCQTVHSCYPCSVSLKSCYSEKTQRID